MLAGDLETAMSYYVEAATSPLRGYVELGPLRVWTRFYLPPELVDQVERHPDFRAIMDREGIDADWRSELEQRVNRLSGITGIFI